MKKIKGYLSAAAWTLCLVVMCGAMEKESWGLACICFAVWTALTAIINRREPENRTTVKRLTR